MPINHQQLVTTDPSAVKCVFVLDKLPHLECTLCMVNSYGHNTQAWHDLMTRWQVVQHPGFNNGLICQYKHWLNSLILLMWDQMAPEIDNWIPQVFFQTTPNSLGAGVSRFTATKSVLSCRPEPVVFVAGISWLVATRLGGVLHLGFHPISWPFFTTLKSHHDTQASCWLVGWSPCWLFSTFWWLWW